MADIPVASPTDWEGEEKEEEEEERNDAIRAPVARIPERIQVGGHSPGMEGDFGGARESGAGVGWGGWGGLGRG